MDIAVELRRNVVNFLSTIPNIEDDNTRRALVYRAGLDPELQAQIQFGSPTATFVELLVTTLLKYGSLTDRRDALEAVLESAKNSIGQDKQKSCDELIQTLLSTRNSPENPRIFHHKQDNGQSPDQVQFDMSDIRLTQQQRNELFDILKQHISPVELKELIYKVLGSNADHNLSGNTFVEKLISFLERVEQLEKVGELFKALISIRYDIDFNRFGITPVSEEKLPEPEPTPFVQFVNRKVEWEKVVLYPKGQYYLFDGPAGYGKTALLKEIEKEFLERNWSCAYISLQEHQTSQDIITHICQQFDIHIPIHHDNPRQTGVELGTALAEKYEQSKVAGIALLLDVEHEPWPKLINTLKITAEKVIPGIFKSLTRHSGYFNETQWSFRVVFAGRYLADEVLKFDIPARPDITRLTPFDYDVVLNICQKYDIKEVQEKKEFAAHLLFYSGGHPRCMVKMLTLYQESGAMPVDFFDSHRDEIVNIAYKEASWVRQSVKRNWRVVFDELCIYRFFDFKMLGQLLNEHSDWTYMAEDGFDLGIKLKNSSLVVWVDDKQRYLHDDITRKLLAIQLRHDNPDALFRSKCGRAEDVCLTRLQNADYERACWTIEALFIYLQRHISQIHERETRQALRQHFMEKELPKVLDALVTGRDHRQEEISLLGILDSDWEFRFTLNYYLRASVYNDEPYQQMLTRIKQFFSSLSKDSGGK